MNNTPLRAKPFNKSTIKQFNKSTIMKKLYYFLLLLPLWGSGGFSVYAQSVQLIGSDFDTGAATFTVDVGAATPTWVLVEYTTDPSPTSAIMSRATFTDVSINPPSAGILAAEDRGFLLTSSATITAKLSGVNDSRFSWCGYAFNVPPNATVNPGGGYTLRGTPPFIIDGYIEVSAGTFGPGTCITSITDFTYNPEGRIPDPPAVTVSASETEVDPGTEVTFTATASSGATTAMTYTWDVAGTTAITDENTYSQILSTPGENTYTVRVTNANGCTGEWSNPGSICVFSAGTIATATVYTTAGNAPATPTVHPASLVVPCFANVEYQWRRSGASAATLSSNTPDYDINLDSDNYIMAGTYYFNRYAKDLAGEWIPAEGTYTLMVDGAIVPPPYARSTQLWTVETGSGALVWSDNIDYPSCTATTQNDATKCMQTPLGKLYGSNYAVSNASTLCPSPWRLGTVDDWGQTLCALYNLTTCINTSASPEYKWIEYTFVTLFSGQYYSNGGFTEYDNSAWYWTATAGQCTLIRLNGIMNCPAGRIASRQKAVRCVATIQ
jgi:uncharacterized protein (TIGR02145 family)